MHRAAVSPEVMPHNSSRWSHVNARTRKKKREKENTRENVNRESERERERPIPSFAIPSRQALEARAADVVKILSAKISLHTFVTSLLSRVRIDRERFGFFIRTRARTDRGEQLSRAEAAVAASRNYSRPHRASACASRYVTRPLVFKCSRIRRAFLRA